MTAAHSSSTQVKVSLKIKQSETKPYTTITYVMSDMKPELSDWKPIVPKFTASVSKAVAANIRPNTCHPMLNRCKPSPYARSFEKYSITIAVIAKVRPKVPCQNMMMPELMSLSARHRTAVDAPDQEARKMSE